MSFISDLDKVPIYVPELGPFTPFHPALAFTKFWTATDEKLLQEDYQDKDFPIPKDRFPYTVCYSWNLLENEALHPESDYVWRIAYKFFKKSPYDLFPRMKTGSSLHLSDRGLYAKFRNLSPLSTYDFNILLQFSAIQVDERVSVASFKRHWKVQWPLEFRRNVVRKHCCGYAYLYRDTHARELVEFTERVIPEGWNLRDGDEDEEDEEDSVRSIVQGIERCGGGESVRDVERYVASIRGREWHCFSGDGGWHMGGERLLFFPIFMKRWWTRGEFSVLLLKERRREREREREKERGLWIERVSGLCEKKEQEQEKQVWTAGPNEVYLDHNGEYVDTNSGESWLITEEKSEALNGCRNCFRPACCQVRRRWNGVFVRILV